MFFASALHGVFNICLKRESIFRRSGSDSNMADELKEGRAALAQCTRDLGFALSKQRQLERQQADSEDRILSLERALKAAQRETANQTQRAYGAPATPCSTHSTCVTHLQHPATTEIAQRGELACEAQRSAQADATSRAEKLRHMRTKLLLLARATKAAEQEAEAAVGREAAAQSKLEDAVRGAREKVQREMRQKLDEAAAREAATLLRLQEVEGRAQEGERRAASLEQQLRARERESRRSREAADAQHAAAVEAAERRALCAEQAAAAAERERESARAKLRGAEAKLGESRSQLEENAAQAARRDEAARQQAAAAEAAQLLAQLERAAMEATAVALEEEAAAREKELARCREQIKKTAALGPQLQSIQHLLDELQPGHGQG